jgi:hypothetical protein
MKTTRFFFAFVLMLSLGSCEKFLQEKPYDFLSENNFFKTEADIRTAINAVYRPYQEQSYYGRTVYLVGDLPGDQIQLLAVSGPRGELISYTFSTTNTEIANWWNNSYVVVNRANDVLGNIASNTTLSTEKKAPLEAETRFLRALAYFSLVLGFGDVPLPLTATKAGSDLLLPRSPRTEVYKTIVDDLKFAETHLPLESKIPAAEKGRPSRGAAAGLLARVLLTRAYLPFAEPGDFQGVADRCAQLVDSKEYRLLPNYADVFAVEKENGPEHVFSIQFDLPPNVGNVTPNMFLPTQLQGFGSLPAQPEFVASFAKEDTVRSNTIFLRRLNNATLPNVWPYKYVDPIRVGNDSRVNWPVLRYADVLLMQSEALNQLNPADPKKYEGLNAVRTRVKLAPITNVPDKAAFADVVLNERNFELCFEGQRRWDLIRMGKLTRLNGPYGRKIEDKHVFFPIPQTELDLNPNLTQNSGY